MSGSSMIRVRSTSGVSSSDESCGESSKKLIWWSSNTMTSYSFIGLRLKDVIIVVYNKVLK